MFLSRLPLFIPPLHPLPPHPPCPTRRPPQTPQTPAPQRPPSRPPPRPGAGPCASSRQTRRTAQTRTASSACPQRPHSTTTRVSTPQEARTLTLTPRSPPFQHTLRILSRPASTHLPHLQNLIHRFVRVCSPAKTRTFNNIRRTQRHLLPAGIPAPSRWARDAARLVRDMAENAIYPRVVQQSQGRRQERGPKRKVVY